MNWNQPLCESCWIDEEGMTTETSDGRVVLVHVRQPVRLATPGIEVCCVCGSHTISGIYVRRNPKVVAFPAPDDEDTGLEAAV